MPNAKWGTPFRNRFGVGETRSTHDVFHTWWCGTPDRHSFFKKGLRREASVAHGIVIRLDLQLPIWAGRRASRYPRRATRRGASLECPKVTVPAQARTSRQRRWALVQSHYFLPRCRCPQCRRFPLRCHCPRSRHYPPRCRCPPNWRRCRRNRCTPGLANAATVPTVVHRIVSHRRLASPLTVNSKRYHSVAIASTRSLRQPRRGANNACAQPGSWVGLGSVPYPPWGTTLALTPAFALSDQETRCPCELAVSAVTPPFHQLTVSSRS